MKLGAVLHLIKSTEETFVLTWVTCDQSRKTGGQVRTMEGLRAGKGEKESLSKQVLAKNKPKSGKYRSSINLYHPESGTHIRVHKRLILAFNHENVVY